MQIKPTPYQIQVKIFEKYGCMYSRTKRDHLIYHCPGAIRPVVIPKYKEIPVFIIQNNMRIVGMTREQYKSLFEEV